MSALHIMCTEESEIPGEKERKNRYWKKHFGYPFLLHYIKWGINEIVHFRAEHCQKCAFYQTKLQISYSELNFIQKSLGAHMSISLRSGATGLQCSIWMKSYNVQKYRCTLELNAAENTHYIKKSFK